MAKDDYHVIVYQILSYLYQCLKKGEPVDGNKLNYGSELLRINKSYWAYVIYNMHRMGLIEGIVFVDAEGQETPYATMLENTRITPAGIDYLCDNSFMEKAKQFLKDIKGLRRSCKTAQLNTVYKHFANLGRMLFYCPKMRYGS